MQVDCSNISIESSDALLIYNVNKYMIVNFMQYVVHGHASKIRNKTVHR